MAAGIDLPHGYLERGRPDEATTESYDLANGKITVTRRVFGNWNLRIQFLKEFFLLTPEQGGLGNIYKSGASYPDIPECFAVRAELVGRGESSLNPVNGQIQWERAAIDLIYETSPQTQDDGSGEDDDLAKSNWLTESVSTSQEFLHVDGRNIVAADDGEQQGENGPFDILNVLLNLELHQEHIPVPPWQSIFNTLGKVNKNVFISPQLLIFPKETLRYDGPTGMTKINLVDGEIIWDITHHYVGNRLNWNKKINDAGQFEAMELKGGRKLFEEGNLYGPLGINMGHGFNPDKIANIDNLLLELALDIVVMMILMLVLKYKLYMM